MIYSYVVFFALWDRNEGAALSVISTSRQSSWDICYMNVLQELHPFLLLLHGLPCGFLSHDTGSCLSLGLLQLRLHQHDWSHLSSTHPKRPMAKGKGASIALLSVQKRRSLGIWQLGHWMREYAVCIPHFSVRVTPGCGRCMVLHYGVNKQIISLQCTASSFVRDPILVYQ